MAKKKFKKGAKCVTSPTMKKVGNQRRCVCTTDSGAWKFLPGDRCRR